MTSKFRRGLLAASAATLGATTSALAHHPGGAANTGGSGAINTIGAVTLEQGHGTAAFLFEYTRLNTLGDSSLASYAGKGEHVHSLATIQSPSIALAYGVTKDLTVSARLPYVRRTNIREGVVDDGSVAVRGDAQGVGDVSALAQYRFYNDQRTGLAVAALAGLKAPTGRTKLNDRSGEPFEAEFSPGTGAWDWSAGMAVSQNFGRTALHANVLHTWVGRSSWDGIEPTWLGNRFQYNLAATYRLLGAAGASPAAATGRMNAGAHSHSHGQPDGHGHDHVAPPTPRGPALDVVLELNGEVHQRQREGGVVDANSGGHTLYLAPGLRYSLDRWSAFASAGFAIVNGQNGIQAEPEVRLLTGMAVSF